jgi:adenosylcobinamide kinase/adenosylcobinamide-phosphate guanylyltransferase
MLTFVVGGARSGKSSLATDLARRHAGPVVYVATSPHIPGDADLAARVAAHRTERPPEWRTDEEPVDLDAALHRAGDDELVVVDCLTLWVNNLMWRGDGDTAIDDAARTAAATAAERSAPTIVVSNEVGLGIHPETPEVRRYRDVLGRVNQRWAAASDRSLLLVAGKVVPLLEVGEMLP